MGSHMTEKDPAQERNFMMGHLVNRLKRLTDDVLPKLRQPDHGIVLGEEIAKNRRLLDDAERLARKHGFLTLRQIDEMMGEEKPLAAKRALESPAATESSLAERLKAAEELLDQLDTWLLIVGTTFPKTKVGAEEQRAKIRKTLGVREYKIVTAHGSPAGTTSENGDGFTEEAMEKAFPKSSDPYMEYLSNKSHVGAQEAIVMIMTQNEGEFTELQKNQMARIAGDMDAKVARFVDDLAWIRARLGTGEEKPT